MFRIVSTENDYPHQHRLSFEYPLEPECRQEDIQAVRHDLNRLNPAKDSYKFLEDTTGITLYFRNSCELFHFRLLHEVEDFTEESDDFLAIGQSFILLNKKGRDKKPLVSINNHFQKARRLAGVPKNDFQSRITMANQTVDVVSNSIKDYIRVWAHMSHKKRAKLELAS